MSPRNKAVKSVMVVSDMRFGVVKLNLLKHIADFLLSAKFPVVTKQVQLTNLCSKVLGDRLTEVN